MTENLAQMEQSSTTKGVFGSREEKGQWWPGPCWLLSPTVQPQGLLVQQQVVPSDSPEYTSQPLDGHRGWGIDALISAAVGGDDTGWIPSR